MRIHTDTLTITEIYAAARFARVDVVELTEHGSRKRARAFNVKLEGESRRRPNGGSSGRSYASGYAATWDQWGVFLSVLYDLDNGNTFEPSAPLATPYYDSADDFHERTDYRFHPRTAVGPATDVKSSNANVVNVRTPAGSYVQHIAAHYWPEDAHGDHRFEYAGVPRTQACKHCSAIQRW